MAERVILLDKRKPPATPNIEAMAVCDICGFRKPESEMVVSEVNGETICNVCYDEED